MPTIRDLTNKLRYLHRMKFYMQTSKIYTRHHLQGRRPRFDSWVGKIPWRRNRLPTPVFLGFPGGSDGKESTCNAGDLGSIPGSGRSSGEENSNPLQYSCLENPKDRGAWRFTVHRVAKSRTRLSDTAEHRHPETPRMCVQRGKTI